MAIVTILSSEEEVAEAAAERVTSLMQDALSARGAVAVCLAGGRTPRRLYELLADAGRPWRARIDWTGVHVFWGDERQVPPSDPESNFRMAHRALLTHVRIPRSQVNRMRGELADPAAAAREYEMILPEAFDIMLLGLGEDAHIASVFPGSPLFRGEGRVAAVRVEHLNAWRITLTPPALLSARAILVLASGDHKAQAVRAALDAPMDVGHSPAQLLRAAGDRVEWIMDAAAGRLRGAPPA